MYNITNITKNKLVLANVKADDAAHAAGKYISALFIAGLVKHCENDIKFNADFTGFAILSKGWDFSVQAA